MKQTLIGPNSKDSIIHNMDEIVKQHDWIDGHEDSTDFMVQSMRNQ